MRKLAYIAALAALLLTVSAPGGIAAAPSGEMAASMGAPQVADGSYRGGATSQSPQAYTSDPKLMGGGLQGQGGFPGSGKSKSSGFDQPASMGQRGTGAPGESGAASMMRPAGEGIVIGIDLPENCLRLREGPTTASRQVGCANMGDRLPLSGQFSRDNRWAQLTDTSWAFVCQIKTNLKPPGGTVACGRKGGSYGAMYERMDWGGPAGYGEYYGGPNYFYRPYWRGHRWHHHKHHWKHGGGKK